MKKFLPLISSTLITFLVTFSISKADIKVVTSIKPIHSLAAYVMDGVAKPDVIVDGYNSPHGFSLKPSHAKMIENADLIIWVGEDLEAFLEKPLNTIAKKSVNIEIMDLKGIKKLKFREKNIFEGHDDMDMVIKKKNTMTTDIKNTKNMMIMVIKKKNTMTTDMKDTHTESTIHMFGWIQ